VESGAFGENRTWPGKGEPGNRSQITSSNLGDWFDWVVAVGASSVVYVYDPFPKVVLNTITTITV
jgi:hypothetical protein